MTTLHESPESSSPIITRAVAAGLEGKAISNYVFPQWQKAVLKGLGRLPQAAARTAISYFQSFSGLDPSCLDNFSLEDLIQARLDDYAHLRRKFPAALLGAGMGGATTFLSLSLDAPFLPQAFVLSLRNGSYRGNVEEYLSRSLEPALSISKRDRRIMTIQHFDPIHDGWLTRFVNHLRFKLVDLPDAYVKFIQSKVQPGGAVIFLDGTTEWLRYRLGERSVFQVGGWGDIAPEEYLTGSPRIDEYAKRVGFTSTHWALNNDKWPLEKGPESEWGCEPGLAEALQNFCTKEGYQFVRIQLTHPNNCSRLSFEAAQKLLEKDGREPVGVLVECFSQFDSTSAMQSGLLPLWLIFNTVDSAKYLRTMSKEFPPEKPVFFSPLSTFSITPDMAAWQDWENAIGLEFVNIGARQSHYPADAQTLLEWAKPLHSWVRKNTSPIISRLTADELISLSNNLFQN